MPPNEQEPLELQPTAPAPEDPEETEPIEALFERTRNTEPDFDGAFMQGRLLSRLFGRPQPSQSIGRYEIRGRLGSGGMGEVYSARDVVLERPVALKLLNARTHFDNQAEQILREARSLAKVQHHHVVRVYEADLHAGRPFLVMEEVKGATLAEWLKEEHSLTQILRLFVGAGRGLIAVHDAGLVHGDFKPRNVLVGEDGIARVVDFGLATAQRDQLARALDLDTDEPRSRRPAGTLPYMAPELFEGRASSEASDQYSFCVALYEAVYGARPFRYDPTSIEDGDFTVQDQLKLPRWRRRRVPHWLRQLLRRGLQPRPTERFESMDALIAELDRDRRGRWVGAGAAAIVSAVALSAIILPGTPIVATVDPLDGVWGASERQALMQAFDDKDSQWSAASRETTVAALDHWSEDWRDLWDLDRLSVDQRSCLIGQRTHVRAMIRAVATGDPNTLRSAAKLVDEFDRPSRCADVAEGSAEPEASLARREALAQATAARFAGHLDEATELLDPLVADALAQGWIALAIDALRERAKLRVEQGRRQLAVEDLIDALEHALDMVDAHRTAAVYAQLTTTADDTSSDDLREHMLRQAGDAVRRLDENPDALRLAVRVQLAQALFDLWRRSDPGEAEARLRENLDELDGLGEARSFLALQNHHALANALDQQGGARRQEAADAYAEALRHAADIVGPAHPASVKILADAGLLALDRRDLEAARAQLAEAVRICEANYESSRPMLVRTLIQLAQVEYAADQPERATTLAERALESLEPGHDRDREGEIHHLLGALAADANDRALALRHFHASLQTLSSDDRTGRALAEVEIATVLVDDGQFVDALKYYDRSLSIIDEIMIPDGANQMVTAWSRRVRALNETGETTRAQAEQRRYLELLHDPEDRTRLLDFPLVPAEL